MSAPLPPGARRICHYWYGNDAELVIFVKRRRYYIRDSAECFPRSPVTSAREPYPGEGTELADTSYETLGLYYNYPMPDTGWSGDC